MYAVTMTDWSGNELCCGDYSATPDALARLAREMERCAAGEMPSWRSGVVVDGDGDLVYRLSRE